jgi:2-oxoglutarate dehydrogenase E2 component (dihydrolipoamide succinyltransferase)
MPQMGESITEGTITKWLKKVGDSVQRDEPLFEISTDKVDAEIPSPVAGVLTEIKVAEGSTVTINTIVAVIGGGASAPAPTVVETHVSESRHGAPASSPVPAPASVAAPAAPVSASEGERLRSSPLVRKIAKDTNVDLAQVPGTGASGRITKSDIVGHLEGGAKAAPVAAAPAPVVSTPVAPAPAKPSPSRPVRTSIPSSRWI